MGNLAVRVLWSKKLGGPKFRKPLSLLSSWKLTVKLLSDNQGVEQKKNYTTSEEKLEIVKAYLYNLHMINIFVFLQSQIFMFSNIFVWLVQVL